MGFWKESREVGAELEPHPSKALCIFVLFATTPTLRQGKWLKLVKRNSRNLFPPVFSYS